MKLVFLMYLEDDNEAVDRLFSEAGVRAYSRLPMEGHGEGAKGWYGDVPSYRSTMAFTVLEPAEADALLEAVSATAAVRDARHPIHAMQVDVERAVTSGNLPHLEERNA